ncbi:4-amino-4-deoxy-L-arabinose transferase-like glycosyltransferase [Dysgonomonas sp. PFB1-18]|uniref:glycosyltransferase family 39 protein n=1 Tax=unclassified Dysgonomonas TaxID=2630389 RepID=UPI002475035F|nr:MULTISPECIES: glycosyltransferase family 39 protein [unclassified Dysgonomonas]MDH6310836.1 4-amino-4-deoxy-L-arabinose transferase-like glycosyltransferase [Dysgonomonas sp. PF1-14]MDH6340726.1 4-amino-4-deoxy-L-arabinose transferase-like glycosyltransferase [Dysgonomonas sp. PF1-16]MDH6382306.1 4-amino-4-deoxy-L-arabinose transferase-like glycosyltransferase [Dysgonomonas sp. PFB1-18]MDH6399656.1 4-amino-4-deoxy-L-arabinose transferase-like glycosyltransferase [Dysgonomonas sp. PF1-23]
MKSFTKIFIYTLLLLSATGLFIYLDYSDTTFLYDDVYSVFMAKASYGDIAKITASDVHPPLYYWGLKTFSAVFGESMFTLRLFSALGVVATLLLGCFPVRRLFGDKVAILFILLVILFPVTQYLVTEIRMYSWTMFFVLACALSAYSIFDRGAKKDWLLFLVTGICASYLHNYGLLSIAGIYALLFIFLFRTNKNWKWVLVCGGIFTLVYMAWFLQLVNQIGMVSEDYWIKPLTINDLFLHIYYFYSPKEVWLPFLDFTKVQMMVGLIVIMAIQLIITLKVFVGGYREKDKTVMLAAVAFIAFLIPIAIGALISVTYLPVLVTRFMTCSFPLFALSLAFILAKAIKYPLYKKLTCLFLLLLFIDGGVRLYSGIKYYDRMEIANAKIRGFVMNGKLQPQRTIFLANSFSYHVMPRLQLIVPHNRFQVLVSDKTEDLRPFVLEKVSGEEFLHDEFVLVHQEREAIQSDFRKFRQSLDGLYMTTDSIHAADIYLYRMKKVTGLSTVY